MLDWLFRKPPPQQAGAILAEAYGAVLAREEADRWVVTVHGRTVFVADDLASAVTAWEIVHDTLELSIEHIAKALKAGVKK